LHNGRYFPVIDIVRFGAASLVMLMHMGVTAWSDTPASQAVLIGPLRLGHAPPVAGLWFGWIGVQVFFVISGLVIANTAAGTSPLQFAKSRLLRLYPAVWICATISAVLCIVLGTTHWLLLRYVGSMLLVPLKLWLSPVYWTLGVEMVFYATVFLWKLRWPGFSPLAPAALLLLWSGAYLAAVALSGHELPSAIERIVLLRHGAYFALGMALFVLSGDRRNLPAYAIAAGATIACLYEIQLETLSFSHQHATQEPALVPMACWLAAVACIYAGTLRAGGLGILPPRLMGAVRVAGLMSYPIYLFHEEISGFVIRMLLEAGAHPGTALAAAFPVVWAAAFCVVRFGEPRLRHALRALLETAEAKFLRGRPRYNALYRTAQEAPQG
jgi:exopolysaccharide production protein ExoZ